ncbi:MAG: glycosyltransferase family 2 protein [Lysobacterales bacterium]
MRLSIVIPSYRREQVLIDTIEYLLGLPSPADEIVLVDQTEQHQPATAQRLADWHSSGAIRWILQQPPSIPAAMNRGLVEARGEIVLFLDDDVRPDADLVAAHRRTHAAYPDALIAGRVIQPWDEGVDFSGLEGFCFAGLRGFWISEFMGGNFSLQRERALALGGFDQNFVRVAYRFEAEFAHRYIAGGGRIRFEPAASLHHLHVSAGGTRSFGEHLTTLRPDHAVGAYYFALRTKSAGACLADFLERPLRAIATRHHLRRPWWIPATLVAELRGMVWAWRLHRAGPKYAGG